MPHVRGVAPFAPHRYPLKLAPRFVPRLWGGDSLPAFHGAPQTGEAMGWAVEGADGALAAGPSKGRAAAARTPIGESWLLGDDNRVTGGPLDGIRVAELASRYGAELLGTSNVDRYGDKLALLAKFLDAQQDLSVQVHPDDAYALEHESASGHLGKAEAWYVLDAKPGAGVLWGFTADVSPQAVRAAVDSGQLESLLNRLPVAAGDVVVNPAGTVHAVGAGVMLFEIQQSSDLTYRLYDYDRRDAAGERRELHLDKALAVADLRRSDPSRMEGRVALAAADQPEPNRWRRRVELPEFVLDVVELGDGAAPGYVRDATAEESLELLVLTRGEAEVRALDAPAADELACVSLRRGDAVLLAASLGAYSLQGSGEVVRSAIEKN